MNGPEDNAKRFTLSSGSFIKGLMLFSLFNLVDVLVSETGARSFPELSFSPFFERTWASLYEALEDGQSDNTIALKHYCNMRISRKKSGKTFKRTIITPPNRKTAAGPWLSLIQPAKT